MTKKVSLSASKIKSLHNCSWIYYASYILKVPQTTNLGASRGLCAHTSLECLVNPRHRKHYLSVKDSNITPAMERLVRKNAKKLNVTEEDDIKMIYDMIVTAVNYDFFCEGAEKVVAEEKFSIESDNYNIIGYIDKTAFSKKDIKIFDYKSSKKKFSREEIEGNIQGLMYSLACYKKHGVIPDVQFLFLRFPKNPVQFFERCTKSQLEGFELYLSSLASHLSSFNAKKATSDLAANSKERFWLCGKTGLKKDGSKAFICQYREPSVYFVLKNKNGEIIKSSFNKKDLKPNNEESIEKINYSGCPAFNKKQEKDAFDFS